MFASTPEYEYDHAHHHRHGHHGHGHQRGLGLPSFVVAMGRGGFGPAAEFCGDGLTGFAELSGRAGIPGFAHFMHGGHGRARRGKLRESILRLLAEQPRNGYQLMAELTERTFGAWSPSPGAVYPCLNQLTDEGLIEAVDLDGQKAYQLTEAGRTAADAVEAEPWTFDAGHGERDRLRRNAEQLRTVFDEFRQLGVALRTAARDASPTQLTTIAQQVANLKRQVYATLATEPEPEA